VESTTIFSKLSPQQKARVVEALRSCGHVVGFMGDGVNDAAAMRVADCGISVDTGADVAKEAADIILLEKDLGVLERGVECGRRTFANMSKYVNMTASSNFGNVFSVLVAAAFLPFLPMSAAQLLFLNFVYDLTCTAMPHDAVDEEAIAVPKGWRTGSIMRFMRTFGPLSSLFDILTFCVLFFLVCPAVAGGTWQSLTDASARALFAGTFQAGWLLESILTQVLAVHLLRTDRVPIAQSRASWQMSLLGVLGVVAVLVMCLTPLGTMLDLRPLPMPAVCAIAAICALYVLAMLVTRKVYQSRFGTLL